MFDSQGVTKNPVRFIRIMKSMSQPVTLGFGEKPMIFQAKLTKICMIGIILSFPTF
jgi:hypothetical protein